MHCLWGSGSVCERIGTCLPGSRIDEEWVGVGVETEVWKVKVRHASDSSANAVLFSAGTAYFYSQQTETGFQKVAIRGRQRCDAEYIVDYYGHLEIALSGAQRHERSWRDAPCVHILIFGRGEPEIH